MASARAQAPPASAGEAGGAVAPGLGRRGGLKVGSFLVGPNPGRRRSGDGPAVSTRLRTISSRCSASAGDSVPRTSSVGAAVGTPLVLESVPAWSLAGFVARVSMILSGCPARSATVPSFCQRGVGSLLFASGLDLDSITFLREPPFLARGRPCLHRKVAGSTHLDPRVKDGEGRLP